MMTCYDVLCYHFNTMLCYVIILTLCYVMFVLHFAMPCYIPLGYCYVMLCYVILYYIHMYKYKYKYKYEYTCLILTIVASKCRGLFSISFILFHSQFYLLQLGPDGQF